MTTPTTGISIASSPRIMIAAFRRDELAVSVIEAAKVKFVVKDRCPYYWAPSAGCEFGKPSFAHTNDRYPVFVKAEWGMDLNGFEVRECCVVGAGMIVMSHDFGRRYFDLKALRPRRYFRHVLLANPGVGRFLKLIIVSSNERRCDNAREIVRHAADAVYGAATNIERARRMFSGEPVTLRAREVGESGMGMEDSALSA